MKCSICGALVTIKGTEIVRTCDHKDAPVVALINAKLKGKGSMK